MSMSWLGRVLEAKVLTLNFHDQETDECEKFSDCSQSQIYFVTIISSDNSTSLLLFLIVFLNQKIAAMANGVFCFHSISFPFVQ